MANASELVGQVVALESVDETIRIGTRLAVAAIVGVVVGYEREKLHKSAGLRTHMLVSLGAAVVAMSLGTTGVDQNASSRIIQGVLQGIGFLGAGTILKLGDKVEVRGLTTAASIWLTASLGVCAGMGRFWLPVVGAAMAWVILVPLAKAERRFISPPHPPVAEHDPANDQSNGT